MSFLAEIFVTVPIVVTLSYLGLTQTRFYYNVLNETKKLKVEKEKLFNEGDIMEDEELEFEKFMERKKYLKITNEKQTKNIKF
eukprot:gene3309-5750_t